MAFGQREKAHLILMKTEDLNLTILVLAGTSPQSLNYSKLSSALEKYRIRIVPLLFNRQDQSLNLFKGINDSIAKYIKNSKAIAVTNIFPDLREDVLEPLCTYHTDQKDHYLYITEFFYKFFLKESFFWLSFNSSHWETIGGFNTLFKFPFNHTHEFIERCEHHGLTQGDLNLRIKKPLYNKLYQNKPEELIKQDQAYLEHTYTSQNYLHHKEPDFLIIGAQKSCSTTLRHSLGLHPEIHIPRLSNKSGETSEINFFNTKLWSQLGTPWYNSFFYHPQKKVAGEKTPEYISDFSAHVRIKKSYPNIKLIAALRNPVNRAWSALQHIRAQKSKWGPKISHEGKAEDAFDLISKRCLNEPIIQKGCYSKQIKSLYSHFPKEQIKIFIHERISLNHNEIYNELFQFLNIRTDIEIPKVHSHKGDYQETRHKETLIRLYDYYRPFNEELFDLLGYRIPEWDMPQL